MSRGRSASWRERAARRTLGGVYREGKGIVFAAQARSTGLGIAYNLAVMVFGGFAQFFVTWLIAATGSPIAPSFYVMFGAAIGVVAAFFLIDRAGDVRLPTLEAVPPTITLDTFLDWSGQS